MKFQISRTMDYRPNCEKMLRTYPALVNYNFEIAGGLEHSRLVYTYYNLIISKFQDKIIHFAVKILLCNHVLCADFLSIPVQSSSDTALLMGFHLI